MRQVRVFHRLLREKALLQFSPPLLFPTLPNFAHFAHLRPDKLSKPVPHREDGGDSKSKTLLFNSTRARPPFYHIHHTENCCRCGMPQVLPGLFCCAIAAVQDGILTWGPRRHSQAFQEDKGKSQLAIWVSCLDGFGPACFPLVFVTELQRWQLSDVKLWAIYLWIRKKTKFGFHCCRGSEEICVETSSFHLNMVVLLFYVQYLKDYII